MERIHTLAIQESCDPEFTRKVEQLSGQKISRCYQCGNCSASCAYTHDYDYPVNQIMRLIQLGNREAVLGSRSIWLCATCQACTTRCPNNLDVAGIMDILRAMSREEKRISEKDIALFHDEFLRSIRAFGRVFETGLLPMFSLKAGKPFTDMDLAPQILKKGKLAFFPHRIKGRRQVSEIFARFESLQENGHPGKAGTGNQESQEKD